MEAVTLDQILSCLSGRSLMILYGQTAGNPGGYFLVIEFYDLAFHKRIKAYNTKSI